MALKRNLIANYLGQGWAALMGLAFVPLYIKYLGIEAYGLIGLFAVLQAWLSLLDMGMTPTLGREMARFTAGTHSNESIRDLLRSIEIIAVGVAVLIAGGVALGSDWIATSWLRADVLPGEVVAQAFKIMGLVTALRFLEGVYRSALVGLQRQVLFNVVNSVMATLRGLGALGILVWVSPTIEAFFLWQAVVSIVTLGILATSTYVSMPKGVRGGRFSLDALFGVWRFAGGVLGITFLALLLTQTDKIILSKMLTLKEFGYYSLAVIITSVLVTFYLPIHQAWVPRLSQLYAENNEDELIRIYHLGAQLVTVIIGSAALILIFNTKIILHIFTQDEKIIDSISFVVQLLTLGKLLNIFMALPYEMQIASGWTSLSIKLNAILVIVLVPALMIIVPEYKSIGAAFVLIFLNVFYVIVGIHLMHKKLLKKEKNIWYWKDIIKPMTFGIAAAVSVAFFVKNPLTIAGQAFFLATSSLMIFCAVLCGANEVRLETCKLIKRKFVAR